MRILCVDDDESICEMLEDMLGLSGLESVAVQDAEAALALIAQEEFSLYVIDTQLLGTSGLGLCEEIRRRDPKTPIVIFSGRAHQSDIDAGMLAGASAYIVKPEVGRVVPTIRRLLFEAA